MLFRDRSDAGRQLAVRLQFLHGEDIVVVGLPRGGVPVAFEVSRALGAPLDVIVVRKLGVPHQPELAFGAIGEGGVRIVNEMVVKDAGLDAEAMAAVEHRERAELLHRVDRLRRGHPRIALAGRTAVIVDDGIATGATARAACRVARAQGATRVVLAAPVAARDTSTTLKEEADQVIFLESPIRFLAVGQWYRNYRQTTDEEVADLLDRAATGGPEPEPVVAADPPLRDDDVRVIAGNVELTGHMRISEHPLGIVVFAHGSGSSRHSPRNRYVAAELNKAGLGTLLFDLLTPDEEIHRANVFDIALLSQRLLDVTGWLTRQHHVTDLPIGYFGVSTGAAAALQAAADPRVEIAAVVSRGGRPDLAEPAALAAVRAPTLLIVGGHDDAVLELNHYAQRAMSCETSLAVVPGATHLFSEPGALEEAAELARDWLTTHLTRAHARHTGSGTGTDRR